MTLSGRHRTIHSGLSALLAAALAAFVLGSAAVVGAFNPSARAFLGSPKGASGSADENKPKLILIGGAPGTGKSTFGMSLALDQGILKCISTDTIRAVMRSFVAQDVSPALHRSSYAQVGG